MGGLSGKIWGGAKAPLDPHVAPPLLEWIMANMVKYPQIQERLLVEIKGVVGDGEKEVKKRI